MIPMELFAGKEECSDDCKYYEGHHFLDDFQLEERKGTAISYEAGLIGGNHEAIFEECDAP